MRKIIFVFAILLFLSPLSATTYYVATAANGGDDAHPGTLAEPWLTLAKSVSTVVSGDTVYLRAGTWEERLNITSKAYTSKTTWARYPSDAVESVIIDGTDITPFEYEDGVIWVYQSRNVTIDGIKVINAVKCAISIWGTEAAGDNLECLNCITDTSGLSGIMTFYVNGGKVQYNTISDSNIPAGHDEILSISNRSTNLDVSYNTLYAGDRTLGATGGEGLNVKAGCNYVYVHHNTVDMARPDLQESDRYAMGVDGWTEDTHHIYFYNNIVKNGAWGIQFNSEEGAQANPDTGAHHLYAWNNIISHIGHSTRMHGGGIGMPSYGNQPGICSDCYWWNNTIYDCYYGALFNKDEIAATIEVKNNIFDNCESSVIAYAGGVNQELITCSNNLIDGTDPKFLNEGTLDFHLTAASTNCIDLGATVDGPPGYSPDVNVDYDGISRPQGAAFDIGAYEYDEGEETPARTMKFAPGTRFRMKEGTRVRIKN